MNISEKNIKKALNSANNNKNPYIKQITLAVASVICLCINYLVVAFGKNNQEFIEYNYSRGFYKGWSQFLTIINRFFKFSLSEITYLVMIMICVILVLLLIKQLLFKQFKQGLTSILIVVLILSGNVVYFQLSWGLNNYREEVETLFELTDRDIDVEDLAQSFEYLVLQSNKYKSLSVAKGQPSAKDIMTNTYVGFEILSMSYDFISDSKSRVKPLLISPLFSMSGYTGIYLPLFSEANVNDMPYISSLGFTASHELAHQKGFASEDEANFVGLLACISQDDPYYKYSGYQAMMVYIGNSLYENDKERYMEIAQFRSEQVTSDLILKREFWETHIKETTNEVHDQVNDAFLKANNQPEGIVNYSKVTELFVKAFKDGLFEEL